MGNHPSLNGMDSSSEYVESLFEKLDYIASHYILTMDFDNLKKLYSKEYCNKLVLITGDIFDKHLTDLDVQQFFKDRLSLRENVGKLSMCREIAVFYIKIAHLFAAIVTTINPEYVYTSHSGKLVKQSLSEKTRGSKVLRTNLCEKRIDALKHAATKKDPPFCYFNLDGKVLTLEDEPGIPELMHLYFDDDFDYRTGKFSAMSEDAKEQFIKDLHEFYKEFTGNKTVPSTITKFSDIKLKNYSKMCKQQNGSTKSDSLLEYANNLKQMISSSKEKQEQLLKIINKIFVSVGDENNKQFIRIHPGLTQKEVQDLIEEARSLIVELYLKCELDFTKGIQLYEAAVEARIFQTTQMQIGNLKKLAESFIERNK